MGFLNRPDKAPKKIAAAPTREQYLAKIRKLEAELERVKDEAFLAKALLKDPLSREYLSDIVTENHELEDKNRSLMDELERAKGEVEELRVQLASCGVAAMQNTPTSVLERAKQGDYGWSVSYGDVCDAVDREIALRLLVERYRVKLSKLVEAGKGISLFMTGMNGVKFSVALDEARAALEGEKKSETSEE